MFNKDTIKGIFLLVLAVSGNFIAETMGCKTQKLLTENMYAKHVIIYLLIYFALGHTSHENPHPLSLAKSSLIIWILFIIFTKMSLSFTIIVFLLLSINYVFNTYIDYLKDQNEKENENLIQNIENTLNNIVFLQIILVIIGFSLYFKKQYNDHKKSWSTLKFIFGVNKCESLK